jgi:anti-anti-sigma factor
LRAECREDVTVVTLTTPRVDETNVHDIRRQLLDLLARPGRHKLLLDLGELEFLSSVALYQFVDLHRKTKAAGGEFRLRNVRPMVYEVFEVTRLTSVLDVRKGQVEEERSVSTSA